MTTTAVKPEREAPQARPEELGSFVRAYFQRIRGGEMGALPAILGLVLLCIGFSIYRPVFFTAVNFANLIPQGAAVIAIAMGLVFVLLLGEIDLSAGYASGVCAAILAKALAEWGMPWYGALLAAMLTGTLIGLVIGFLVAKVGIPSFVVTLAGLLAFQGVVLQLIKGGTIVSIDDSTVKSIGNSNLTPLMGWVMFAVLTVGYAAVQVSRMVGRRRRGLKADPVSLVLLRVGGVAAVLGFAVFILNEERSRNPALTSLKGVPMVVPIIAVLLIGLTFVLKRTRFGLHIYAVGGNREAARRAGINTDRIVISAFILCSTLASIGGIIAASRASSVDPNTGGSNVLLYAVGAAVIGGTSLFGGKGRVLDAVLGGAVVAVIINGMGLLNVASGVKFIVTGLVLLLAAAADALSRRRAANAGLR